MDEKIYSILSSDAVISSQVGDNIYPNSRKEEKTLPCLVWKTIRTTSSYNWDKRLPTDLHIDVFIYASTAAQATQLLEALLNLSYSDADVRFVSVDEFGNSDYLPDLDTYTDSAELIIEFINK